MTTTSHGAFSIERLYAAPPQRVFAAWADPVAKRAWFAEGKGSEVQSYHLDFRNGGAEIARYRFLKGEEMFGKETTFGNDTTFNEIIPNERIIFTYAMSRDGVRFSVSLATVEFSPPKTAHACFSLSMAPSSMAPTARRCAKRVGATYWRLWSAT